MLIKVLASGSSGNCYIVESNNEMMILDFGIKWKEILKGIDYMTYKVAGALLTHEHGDHSKSYKDLIFHAIQIYTNQGTINRLNDSDEMIALDSMKRYKIGDFKVVPFNLPHTTRDKDTGIIIPCENFGYYVDDGKERLAYLTDFEYCSLVLKSLKINHFLVECNHIDELMDKDVAKYEHSVRGHSSLKTVLDFLRVNITEDTKTITLCHISKEFGDEEEMLKQLESLVGDNIEVNIAKKGLCIET